MSSLIYLRTSSRIQIEGSDYTVYGIVRSDGQECIEDISTCSALVERILEDLNRGEVSPLHFREVLDDLIAKYE
ncbi:MAG: hypothetical protein HFG27_05895 [Provencibacterium sp.]|jgi:hypothetical protein|nr:hypothetical protein [Provencibacterium sp.]